MRTTFSNRIECSFPSRRSRLALATVLWIAALLGSAAAQTRDLVVLAEPTLERALKSIGASWQARTGTRVNVFVASTALSLAQIERGARCDVILALAGASTDDAARRGVIQAASVRRVLRNGLALVGNAAEADLTAAASLSDISRLIAGKKLAIADPERDPAGRRAADLLAKLGIAFEQSDSRVAVAESSAGVVSLLATGKTRLGIVHASDAIARPPFKLVVPLPAPEQPIEYVAAQARDPVIDTAPFLSFLTSAQAQATFRSAGLSPIGESEPPTQGAARRP
jgi:molybdate transport system substrate-binding protein